MARSPSRTARGRKGGSGAGPESTLRLIGGAWRSRKLPFREIPGLRPTPDRVRETLFNWLAPIVPGAYCLDLFAGSGALGLEALSRGAGETWFVETHGATATALRSNLQLLNATTGHVWHGDAEAFLAQPCQRPFDIVFLDPPFRHGWLDRICPLLESGGWIAPCGRVYLEYERENPPTGIPLSWHSLRKKEAGQLTYHLFGTDSAR
jgi:16S rRNA (guanine966-N2)-methyltransferase